ncbi:MAG: dihydrodipicolinate synthase family protein [Kiritimatiellales bacterium]
MKAYLKHFKSGVIVPMVTPLNPDESPDLPAIGKLVDFLVDRDVHGIFTLGTTGEVSRLSPDDCLRTIESTVEAVNGRLPVYAGISAATGTQQTLKNLKRAEAAGVDFTVATLPYYFPVEDLEEQVEFFLKVADTATRGILLYNIPWTVVAPIQVETIKRLVEHPNIIGIKDSSGDRDYLEQMIALRNPESFRILCGHEGLFSDTDLLSQTDGIISSTANILPSTVSNLWKNIIGGRDTQIDLERIGKVNSLNRCAPYSSTVGLALRKLVLSHFGLIQPVVSQPHTRFSPEDLKQIHALAEKIADWENVTPMIPAAAC